MPFYKDNIHKHKISSWWFPLCNWFLQSFVPEVELYLIPKKHGTGMGFTLLSTTLATHTFYYSGTSNIKYHNVWKKVTLEKKNKQDLREQCSVDYGNVFDCIQTQLKAIKHCQHTQTNYW